MYIFSVYILHAVYDMAFIFAYIFRLCILYLSLSLRMCSDLGFGLIKLSVFVLKTPLSTVRHRKGQIGSP